MYKNKLTSLIKHSEKKYYQDRFQDLQRNIRDTWRLINEVIHEQPGILNHLTTPSTYVDCSLLNDPVKVANKCNDFFVNIGSDLEAKKPPVTRNIHITDIMSTPNSSSMFIEPCTADEIASIISELKNSKGTGVNGFLTSVIEFISLNIADP